jgi:cephalosporin hydroxylase
LNALEQAYDEMVETPFVYWRPTTDAENKLEASGTSIFRYFYERMMEYGKQCDHITEIGVNYGKSGKAWLMCNPKKLIGIDISSKFEKYVREFVSCTDTEYTYITANSLDLDIEQTDLLYLDGDHSHYHVLAELRKFAPKVNKFLMGDDIGAEGRPGPTGYHVERAFRDFLNENDEWEFEYKTMIGTGMIVLKRKGM